MSARVTRSEACFVLSEAVPRAFRAQELRNPGYRVETRPRRLTREDLLEKVRGDGVQRVTLGLLGFDQLEETARPAWALQANREPDADRVVGRLQGLLARPPRLHPRRPRPSRGGAPGRSIPLTFLVAMVPASVGGPRTPGRLKVDTAPTSMMVRRTDRRCRRITCSVVPVPRSCGAQDAPQCAEQQLDVLNTG